MARAAAILIVALAAATAPSAHAQTADGIVSMIERDAALYGDDPACMVGLAMRESSLDPDAENLASGAYGLYEFEPGGIWASTPYGRQGIPPSAVSWQEQARMAAMLMSEGQGSAWGVWC